MKTIKDALQSTNVEQRRRILKNIEIDKDSKNFIVSGKVGGTNVGGSEDENNSLIYYKKILGFYDDYQVKTIVRTVGMYSHITVIVDGNNESEFSIAPATMCALNNNFDIIIGGIILKQEYSMGETKIPVNSLDDIFAMINDSRAKEIIIPISKEEFYELFIK